MAKPQRPSLLDSISAEVVPQQTDAGEGTPAVVHLKAPPKSDVVKSTIYLPPQAHRKLKEIAFTRDCKVHDLIMEGVSHVLKENGFPTINELKEK